MTKSTSRESSPPWQRLAAARCVKLALALVIAAAMQAPLQAAPATALPLASQPSAIPLRPTTWDAMWDVTWQRAAYYHRIDAATTTAQDPTCQGNLGIDVIVKNTILAVSLRKTGDAARFMSQFQDVTQCLTREGARGVEFALAMYVHRAVTVLPPAQAQIAVQGVMNLGMQIFDELQYTGQSWWLMMVNIDNARIQSLLVNYPRRDLALWLYDFDRGMMVQSGLTDGVDRLVWAMQRIDNFGQGACNLLNMSATGFVCPDKNVAGGGGKDGAADMTAPPGGIPSSGVSCVLASVRSSGVRGQFACLSRAIAGMVFDPRTAGSDLSRQASQQPGIRDKLCTLSAEGDTATTDTTTATTTTKAPTTWEKVKDTAGKVKDVAASIVTAIFDKTPPVVDVLAQGASLEGADAVRGGLQAAQAFKARASLFSDTGYEDYVAKRDARVTTDPQANKRTVTGDGTQTGGGCGAGSNAAARAKTMYQCTMGSDMSVRQQAGGTGGIRNPGSGPTPNPTIALLDPAQAAGPLPGAMSCQLQGGDLPRLGVNDQRCATMRCVPGQACACNSPGVAGQPMEMKPPTKAGPECADGPCVVPPGKGGVITAPGTGGVPGGPLPVIGGGTITPPPGGPAPGPATAPVPPRP